MQERRDRNRKRSKRRAIYCPIHGCFLDSTSPKYPLYADEARQLQARGINRKTALILTTNSTAFPLVGEWIEGFWCPQCQATQWYHVHKSDKLYKLEIAPVELWQRAVGVYPEINSSVGEFTLRHARSGHSKYVN